MTPEASDDWWSRSLARLGVEPRRDNDAPVLTDIIRETYARTEFSDFGAVNPSYRDNRHA